MYMGGTLFVLLMIDLAPFVFIIIFPYQKERSYAIIDVIDIEVQSSVVKGD